MKRKNKKKKLRLLVIFILLFALISYFFHDYDFDVGQVESETTDQSTESRLNQLSYEVRDKIKKANIYLQTNYQDGYEFGSGTIINEDETYYYAITNYHVIDGNNHVINSYEVMTYDEITTSFEIITYEENLDLALIKFSKASRDESIEPLSINNQSSIDDLVCSIGNPSGTFGQITYGFIHDITQLRELELTHEVIEHSATLLNGSSGGALVNNQGELLGINTWTLNGSFYAIRSSVINDFLINNI